MSYDPLLEYAYRIILPDAVQTYMNEQALQGYKLVNIQPYARIIKDTSDGTFEEVKTVMVTMERIRKTAPREVPALPPVANPSQ